MQTARFAPFFLKIKNQEEMMNFINDYNDMIETCENDEEKESIDEEFGKASRMLESSIDELVRVEDIRRFLNYNDYSNSYFSVFKNNIVTISYDKFQELYYSIFKDDCITVDLLSDENYRVVVKGDYKFIWVGDGSYSYMIWNAEELREYLDSIADEVREKCKNNEGLFYSLYDLFMEV